MASSLDIVALINDTPITKLSRPYQSKLINKIKHHFNTEAQQLFVASFYCYLNHDKFEFVVNFDKVWEWLGFSCKGNAKRTLERAFKEGVDYVIEKRATSPIGKVGGSGLLKETILLTIKTFKKFCLLADTKKAKEIHEYYITLEEMLHELVDEETSELRNQLQNTQAKLENTELVLQASKNQLQQLTRNQWYGQECGDVVYIYRNNTNEEKPLLKIGQTKNLAKREAGYNTYNQSGDIVYAKRCHNSDLLEKVVHQILDKFRVHPKREWFDITLDIAITTIEAAQIFLDGFIPYADALTKCKLVERLNNALNIAKEESTESPSVQIQAEPTPYKNMYTQITEKETEQKEISRVLAQHNINNYGKRANNPNDFDNFIQECCELHDDYFCLKAELYGCHKLWSRCAEKTTRDSLYEYCTNRFKSGKRYFPDFNAYLAVYYGVRPHDFKFTYDNPESPNVIEKFITERCKVGYFHRSCFNAFFKEYEDWYKSHAPDFTVTLAEKRKLQEYLARKFFPSHVYLSTKCVDYDSGGSNRHGVWGITINSDNTGVGVKLSDKLRKRVCQVNVETNTIVNVFESVQDAGVAVGIGAPSMSSLIRFQKARSGFVYKFENDCSDLERDIGE